MLAALSAEAKVRKGGLGSGVPISCIDVAAALVELLQHAATSARCNAAACSASRLPKERAGNQRIDPGACLDEGEVAIFGRGVDVGHEEHRDELQKKYGTGK